MFNWLRHKAVAAIALGALAFVPTAKADSVKFYTSGTFSVGSNPGVIASSNGDANLAVLQAVGNTAHSGQTFITVDNPTDGSTSTLSFTFSGNQIVPLTGGVGNVSGFPGFGTFAVSSQNSVNYDVFDGIGFTLNIYQTSPITGDGSLVGQVSGNLQYTDEGTASTLKVVFNPNQVVVPAPNGVLYTIAPSVLGNTGTVTIGGGVSQTPIDGTAAVPLPATASAGLWLLGGLGALAAFKKFAGGRVLAGI